MMRSWLTRHIFFSSKKLRQELAIAFGLVILVFLVFLGYLFPGASPIFTIRTYLPIVILIVTVLTAFALFAMIQMVEPVIKMTHDAKKIAEGDTSYEIKLARQDEIGELGDALNRMSRRIKENMEELKVFSEKTESINTEINKRILGLSSLLQISNLISQNVSLDEILEVGIEKSLLSGDMYLGCFILKDRKTNEFTVKSIYGAKSAELVSRGMENFQVKLGEGLLGKVFLKPENIVIDKDSKETAEIAEFKRLFSVVNAMVVPVFSRNKIQGLLITGNDKNNFTISNSDLELLELLSKQISIALDNDFLATKVEKLEITDNLTGLYNSVFARERLEEEIRRAVNFQRPCAFVVFMVDKFKEYYDAFGHISAEHVLIRIGSILKENIGDVDKAARFADHEFALILPEKNKRQAIELADEIRRKIAFIFSEEEDVRKKLTCTGVVTENPVDGITADELILKGRTIIESAKLQDCNKIYYRI